MMSSGMAKASFGKCFLDQGSAVRPRRNQTPETRCAKASTARPVRELGRHFPVGGLRVTAVISRIIRRFTNELLAVFATNAWTDGRLPPERVGPHPRRALRSLLRRRSGGKP
jgi:hypothetical protein